MRLPKLKIAAEFVAHDDWVEQRFTATNLGDQAGEFSSSSCFRLQGLPMFYDCEQLRTYAANASGEFVPVRHLARGDSRVHWITGLGGAELGGDRQAAVLAVVSRDKQRVIAAGRADRGTGFSLATNTLFTCLHIDSAVPVAAGQQTTTREIFWFFEGTLDNLRRGFDETSPRRENKERTHVAIAIVCVRRTDVPGQPSPGHGDPGHLRRVGAVCRWFDGSSNRVSRRGGPGHCGLSPQAPGSRAIPRGRVDARWAAKPAVNRNDGPLDAITRGRIHQGGLGRVCRRLPARREDRHRTH